MIPVALRRPQVLIRNFPAQSADLRLSPRRTPGMSPLNANLASTLLPMSRMLDATLYTSSFRETSIKHLQELCNSTD
jgi:hypothetical protein